MKSKSSKIPHISLKMPSFEHPFLQREGKMQGHAPHLVHAAWNMICWCQSAVWESGTLLAADRASLGKNPRIVLFELPQ